MNLSAEPIEPASLEGMIDELAPELVGLIKSLSGC
jgi:hypothetical protein